MFQFPGFPSAHYGFMYGWLRCAQPGFPIQRSPDQWICAPPRSFSQLITSFIGSQCQGIRPVLFLAWPSRYHSVDIRRLCCLVFTLRCFRNASFRLYLYVLRILRCFVYAVFKVQCLAPFQKPVEIKRFELSTPCLQGRCSPN